jgi:hypothetical protein
MTTTPLCERGGTVAAWETPTPMLSRAMLAATTLTIFRPVPRACRSGIISPFVVDIGPSHWLSNAAPRATLSIAALHAGIPYDAVDTLLATMEE